MVFDEAHNLSSALSEIHSPRVTRDMLTQSLRQLEAYHARYTDRLSSLSHSFLIHLQTVLRALLAVLTPSRAVFFRSLWHGCTTNHMLEIAPISGVDESSFPDQSHLVVLQCGSVFSPSLLHSRSTWK